MLNFILASKSKVRKEILEKNKIVCSVEHSNVDEEPIKDSLLNEGATPETISKNLAELKANKVSQKKKDALVLGADSVIDINGELISKPKDRKEALNILKKLNGKKHFLISSVCISKNDEALYSYNVYQIEGEGKALFSKIEGNEDTIMGLPIDKIKEYLINSNIK